MMAARLAEAAAEVTPAVRHRYRRERSALQPVPERDVGVQQLRYGAGLFRVLGNLRESGFIDSGYGRRQFQVRPGDGKPVSLLVEHDRGERFQRPLGETLAFKREAERHGEAAGVGSGDQFFGVGSALLLEPAAEDIGRFLKEPRAREQKDGGWGQS